MRIPYSYEFYQQIFPIDGKCEVAFITMVPGQEFILEELLERRLFVIY